MATYLPHEIIELIFACDPRAAMGLSRAWQAWAAEFIDRLPPAYMPPTGMLSEYHCGHPMLLVLDSQRVKLSLHLYGRYIIKQSKGAMYGMDETLDVDTRSGIKAHFIAMLSRSSMITIMRVAQFHHLRVLYIDADIFMQTHQDTHIIVNGCQSIHSDRNGIMVSNDPFDRKYAHQYIYSRCNNTSIAQLVYQKMGEFAGRLFAVRDMLYRLVSEYSDYMELDAGLLRAAKW